jgi:uncharacterized protein with von Willebrand factor type A (vWA) domain
LTVFDAAVVSDQIAALTARMRAAGVHVARWRAQRRRRLAPRARDDRPHVTAGHGGSARRRGRRDGQRAHTARPAPAAWSDRETLRAADFAQLDATQLQRVQALLATLAKRGALRPSRRTRSVARRPAHGGAIDLRATVRRSLRTDGEPLQRHWRERRERPRRLVFVLDVSGSMRPYAQALLLYVHGFVAHRPRVEAFLFGTRLTRVTRELTARDPAAALARVQGSVEDWSGGTRIGAALAELNRAHGRSVGRGAIVVVLSDGWDRGDPEQLALEAARLRRCAHRLVWLNPLKARPGYEPLTRGMQAALPHLDAFLAGNSVASLEQLGALLERGLEPRAGGLSGAPARG